MSTLRNALAAAVIVALGAGYAASQWAYFSGEAARYAQQVDTPQVKAVALLILVLAVVLGFIPEREEA